MEKDYIAHYGRSIEDGAPGVGTGNWIRTHSGTAYLRSHAPRHPGLANYYSTMNPKSARILYDQYTDLHRQGLTDPEIAKKLNYHSSNDLRIAKRLATNIVKQEEYDKVMELYNQGYNKTQISKIMGKAHESSIRSIFKNKRALQGDQVVATAKTIMDHVNENNYVNVSLGNESLFGINGNVSKNMLDTAVKMAHLQGYEVHTINVDQLGTEEGKKTKITCVCPPGTTYDEVKDHYDRIHFIGDVYSEDGGETYRSKEPPAAVSSDRVYIKYGVDSEGKDLGKMQDGVIEIRPGVPDLSLGSSRVVQARINVDDKYYIKGMALYSDNVPEGYDILVNSNKKPGTPIEDVLKPLNKIKQPDGTETMDTINPFGALIKEDAKLNLVQKTYEDADGNKHLSAINVVNEEGDWYNWGDTLPPQFLAKQKPELIAQQLKKTLDAKEKEFQEIESITNPVLKQKQLNDFADECDSNSEHLKAVPFDNQKYAVIMPINSLATNEVYAPNHNNGDHLALIRFPHSGPFEIPELIVNNNNKEGQEKIGNAKDIIGFNYHNGPQLSGADFDGDTVMVINMKDQDIKTAPAYKELLDFDTKMWRYPDEVIKSPDFKEMSEKTKQTQMGVVSNLIADMYQKDADGDEILRAVMHSMVVIDAKKHKLNWKASEEHYGIKELKKKYQGSELGGASTLITRAKNEKDYDQFEEVKSVSRMTPEELKRYYEGEKIYRLTGEQKWKPKQRNKRDPETGRVLRDENGKYIKENVLDENGRIVWESRGNKKTKATQMSMVDDAHKLKSSPEGTAAENLYADFANTLKGYAKNARKEARNMVIPPKDTSKAAEYRDAERSLRDHVRDAIKNKPFEQQAQILGNKLVEKVEEQNGERLTGKERSKQQARALQRAREIYGAKRPTFELSDREWEAIQSGAIAPSLQREVFKYTDQDALKKRAMPKASKELTPSMQAAIRAKMSNPGTTQAQVAEDLGISVSTVNKYMSEN